MNRFTALVEPSCRGSALARPACQAQPAGCRAHPDRGARPLRFQAEPGNETKEVSPLGLRLWVPSPPRGEGQGEGNGLVRRRTLPTFLSFIEDS
jgi:hypothetical protein